MTNLTQTRLRDITLASIAETHLFIETLEMRGQDDLDFHEAGVGSLKDALEAAFEAGKRAAGGQ